MRKKLVPWLNVLGEGADDMLKQLLQYLNLNFRKHGKLSKKGTDKGRSQFDEGDILFNES